MKFSNLKANNLEKFFEVVNNCKGNVYLVSPDVKLNLKSRLTQYFSFAKLCNNENADIKELEVITDNTDDVAVLFKFMSGVSL